MTNTLIARIPGGYQCLRCGAIITTRRRAVGHVSRQHPANSGMTAHGGQRAGAGRPPLLNKVRLTATVQQQHLDYLTERAVKSGITVSELLREIIESVSECYCCDPHIDEANDSAVQTAHARIAEIHAARFAKAYQT